MQNTQPTQGQTWHRQPGHFPQERTQALFDLDAPDGGVGNHDRHAAGEGREVERLSLQQDPFACGIEDALHDPVQSNPGQLNGGFQAQCWYCHRVPFE